MNKMIGSIIDVKASLIGKKLFLIVNTEDGIRTLIYKNFNPYIIIQIDITNKIKLINFLLEKIKKYKNNIVKIRQIKLNSFFRGKCISFYIFLSDNETFYKIKKDLSYSLKKVGIRLCNFVLDIPELFLSSLNVKYTEYETIFEINDNFICENITISENIKKNNKLMIGAFDIEVITKNMIINPYLPENEIILISFCVEKIIYVFINKSKYDKLETLQNTSTHFYIYCINELDTIKLFLNILTYKRPFFLTGYNIFSFDWWYIDIRLKIAGFLWKDILSNEKYIPYIKRITWSSNAYGERDYVYPELLGIISIDLYDHIKKMYINSFIEMDDFKLDTISYKLLGKRKISLKNDKLQQILITGENLNEAIKYCINDSLLVLELFEKLDVGNYYLSFSSLSCLNVQDTVISATQVKIYSRLYNYCKNKKILLDPPISYEIKLEAGLVLEVKKGLYNNVALFDFTSLYPNIVIGKGVCPTTWNYSVSKPKFKQKEGILSGMLKEILELREKMKTKMNNTNNDTLKKIFNSYQNAAKILANSVIGSLSTKNTRYISCLPLGMYVFQKARKMITKSKEICQSLSLNVLYGDTDSIIIEIGTKKVQDIQKLLIEKYGKISIMKLEGIFEKIIFFTKKRYIFLKNHQLVCKGVPTVRSDVCKFSRIFLKNLYKFLFMGKKDITIFWLLYILKILSERKIDIKLLTYTTVYKTIYKKNSSSPFSKFFSTLSKTKPGSVIHYTYTYSNTKKVSDKLILVNNIKSIFQIDVYYIYQHDLQNHIHQILELILDIERTKVILECINILFT